MNSMNFIFKKSYWDEAARTNPFASILHNHNEEKFWATQPKIPGLRKDMVFLDFGCGIGRVAKSISPLIKEYYGVDYSEEMITKAKTYYKDYNNVKFFVNNGYGLNIFEDNTFDFVYECLVFIHVQKEHIVEYINEIFRVLKPGGMFYTVTFPKQKMYINGFLLSETQKVFSNFEEVDIKENGEWYHSPRCKK